MYFSAEVMSVQDDDIIFQGNAIVCHTLEDLSLRPEPASSSRPAQAEPTTAARTASIVDSDPQTCARSTTLIPVSFDTLRDDPIPLKRCVLWNLRAFMVRTMASAKEKRRGRVKSNTLSAIRKPLVEDVFDLTHCNVHLLQHICEQYGAHLCCPRSQPENNLSFCMNIQTYKKYVRVHAARGRLPTPQLNHSLAAM